MDIKKNYKSKLETDRLILSPWKIDFAEKMFLNWATDVDVTKYLFWNVHKDIEETKSIINFWINEDNYNWCIVDKISNEPIGSINVVRRRDIDFCCEIGYCLSKKFWNKGVMTEALKAVLEFLFTENYNKIELRHAVENVASGRVMQKTGMKFLCTSPKDTYVKGKFYDTNYYYILKEDFEKNI